MGTTLRISAEGNGPLLEGVVVPVGSTYRVLSVSMALNVGAATSENLLIGLDAIEGANYDVIFYTLDPSTIPTLDMVWWPDGELRILGGDRLGVGWANTDGRTWGLLMTVEVV